MINKKLFSYLIEKLKQPKQLSFNLSLFEGIFFSLLFFSYLVISYLFSFSLGLKIFISILILLLWKLVQGMSWLNFYFLLLSTISLSFLSLWFNKLLLLIEIIIFIILIVKKIIYNQNNTNHYLLYFSEFNWALMSYGLYFYANQFFAVSLIIFLLGFSILAFYRFLLQNKKIQINFLVFLLISLELYWLFSYLSINGFLFSFLIVLLNNIIILQI